MKKFIESLQLDIEKLGMKSQFYEEKRSLRIWPSSKEMRKSIHIKISINMKFISIISRSTTLNRYILDVFDILCSDYGYDLSFSGIPTWDNQNGTSIDLEVGSIWGILKKL